jgi:D-xylose 1-dehydrogenase (NADP+, D-xylono-1,5-lactone-forming)
VTVAWGLLSTARINGKILVAARESDEAEVVAIASRERARAERYARDHEIARAHGSYEEVLADPAVEAIYNPLPNSLHVPWTLRALEAGKHVLCEKPFSRRAADVEAAFALAERQGLVLSEAFMYRHHPQTKRVAELVREGAVGRLRAIRAVFTFGLTDRTNIRMLGDLDGGALMDVGAYCVNGSRLLAGEPERVYGEQTLIETGVDIAFHGTMRFPGDVVSQFEASFAAPVRQRLEAIGEEGVLVVEAPWRVDWGGDVLVARDGRVERVEIRPGNSYRLELDDMAAAIKGEKRPLLGREDAVGQARSIEALYRSADEGLALELPVP